MIRYYEQLGTVRAQRDGGGHRRYREAEVQRLRKLHALAAAGISPRLASRCIDGHLPPSEALRVRGSLAELRDQIAETERHLQSKTAGSVPSDGNELINEEMFFTFDIFLIRTQVESIFTAALKPAGVTSTDYALLSLLRVEGQLTPAVLIRVVGAARSTLTGRLDRLRARGWIRRRVNPDDARSWLLELTPAGTKRFLLAYPLFNDAASRINEAVRAHGLEPDHIRPVLQHLAAALRPLVPENDTT